ncbi:hypothetical protein ABZ917_22345 [Nonomuraea wenchangensis]
MGRAIVVGADPVTGTDRHNVVGVGPNPGAPPPTLPYTGIGSFTYTGSMTDDLSDFVLIGGRPVALVTSRSTLDAGETGPSGGHAGPQGSDFVTSGAPPAAAAQPTTASLSITDSPLGTGTPAAAAGSALLTVGGARVLLDGDPIDSCGGSSTVTARGQDFVTCSA